MVKISNCCCCISIETGTIILGVLSCLNILQYIAKFELMGFMLTLAVCIAFVAMLVSNQAITRLLFLITYIAEYVGCMVLTFLVLDKESGGFNVTDHAKSACSGMTEEDLAKFTEAHGEECEESMKRYIMYAVITCLSFTTLVFVHFALVIATYYTEACEAEDKESGEAGEEGEPLI